MLWSTSHKAMSVSGSVPLLATLPKRVAPYSAALCTRWVDDEAQSDRFLGGLRRLAAAEVDFERLRDAVAGAVLEPRIGLEQVAARLPWRHGSVAPEPLAVSDLDVA